MHFEPSQQLLIDWVCAGLLPGVTRVPRHPCPGQAAEPGLGSHAIIEPESSGDDGGNMVADSASHDSMDDYLATNEPAYETESGAVA